MLNTRNTQVLAGPVFPDFSHLPGRFRFPLLMLRDSGKPSPHFFPSSFFSEPLRQRVKKNESSLGGQVSTHGSSYTGIWDPGLHPGQLRRALAPD